jgi:hypothetical protein
LKTETTAQQTAAGMAPRWHDPENLQPASSIEDKLRWAKAYGNVNLTLLELEMAVSTVPEWVHVEWKQEIAQKYAIKEAAERLAEALEELLVAQDYDDPDSVKARKALTAWKGTQK